jgi:hypothetical protein
VLHRFGEALILLSHCGSPARAAAHAMVVMRKAMLLS